jgi:putative phosphoribosyl transferase
MNRYHDREHAARTLADTLSAHRGTRPLILTIPRGAVPIGAMLAESLKGDLDVVLVRKIGAAGNPEFAIGSVDEQGMIHIADDAAFFPGARGHLHKEAAIQLRVLRKRRALYTPAHTPVNPEGRTVIIVDDGMATGATMIAAIASVRPKAPARIIAACPVASADAVRLIAREADGVAVPIIDENFGSVSRYYDDFREISDEEVVALLRQRS